MTLVMEPEPHTFAHVHDVRSRGFAIIDTPDTCQRVAALASGLTRLQENPRLQDLFYDELKNERDQATRALISTGGLYHDPRDDRWSFVYDDQPNDLVRRWCRLPELAGFVAANASLCALFREEAMKFAVAFDHCYESVRDYSLAELVSNARCKLRTMSYEPDPSVGRAKPEENTAALNFLIAAGPGRTVVFGQDGMSDAGGAERNPRKAVLMSGKGLARHFPWMSAAAHRVDADTATHRFAAKLHMYF
jgi:hypothetical protein